MKQRRVGIYRRKNRDGSMTWYLRWKKMDGSGGMFSERCCRSSPCMNKRERDQCERQAWAAARDKEKLFNSDAAEFVDACDMSLAADYYIRSMDGERSASTIDRLCRVLPEFVCYILNNGGPRQVHKLLSYRVVRYRDWLLERGLNKSTICCYLSDISGWLQWCVGENYATCNVAGKDKVNYPRRTLDRAANPLSLEGAEQYWRMMSGLKTDWQVAVVGVLACSGLRMGEARQLEWDAYDPERSTLSVMSLRNTRTKKHQRTIPTCDALRAYLIMLKMINDEGPYIIGIDEGRRKVNTQIATLLKPFGVTPHDLRRWFRTALETTSPRQFEFIDDILGHRASRTRSAYSRRHNIEAYAPIMDRFNQWLMWGRPSDVEIDIPPEEVV